MLQPPLAEGPAIWAFRARIFVMTALFVLLELVAFGLLAGIVTLDLTKWVWHMFFMRAGVLLAACLALYALLELADRLHLIAAVATLMLSFIPIALVHQSAIRFFAEVFGRPPLPPETLLLAADYWIQFLLLWGACVLALFYHKRLKREQDMRLTAAQSAHRARMRALRYRLNPHFLFNTLNSIGLLSLERDQAAATSLVNRLSAFLRLTLSADPNGFHSLKHEFQQASDYLGIERTRFPEKLSFEVRLPSNVEGVGVPVFILQPLLERVVSQGLSQHLHPVHVDLTAQKEGEQLCLILKLESLQIAQDGHTDSSDHPAFKIPPISENEIAQGFSFIASGEKDEHAMVLRGPWMVFPDDKEGPSRG